MSWLACRVCTPQSCVLVLPGTVCLNTTNDRKQPQTTLICSASGTTTICDSLETLFIHLLVLSPALGTLAPEVDTLTPEVGTPAPELGTLAPEPLYCDDDTTVAGTRTQCRACLYKRTLPEGYFPQHMTEHLCQHQTCLMNEGKCKQHYKVVLVRNMNVAPDAEGRDVEVKVGVSCSCIVKEDSIIKLFDR
ncbi:uncharacterized protein LOC118405764 isoform X1 [Branchiostoma floridae]|uniref:Uncharacterized protein LOC118405764 isoform X1 n=1 Tax=Branchiostoma floridae TaxID=7739 RepID=A0A9J7K8U5_BRAFL|nr:uncharacterized protein LOC118405764 isoform X1 [Branchiostoma floridae]